MLHETRSCAVATMNRARGAPSRTGVRPCYIVPAAAMALVVVLASALVAPGEAARVGWPSFVDHSSAHADVWDPFNALRVATCFREAPAFVDWTGDGLADLVVAHDGLADTPGVRFYKNVGTATRPAYEVHAAANNWYPVQSSWAQQLSFGDMDGDGLPDAFLTVWEWYSGRPSVNPSLSFRSHRAGTGLASVGSGIPPSAAESVMAAFIADANAPGFVRPVDFDDDGDLDLVLAPYPCCGSHDSTPLRFYTNHGTATAPVFNGTKADLVVPVAGIVLSLDVVDLNNDGMLDVVYGGAKHVGVLKHLVLPYPLTDGAPAVLNTSVSKFTVLPSALNPFNGLDLGAGSFMPALADLDGDGDLDVVVGHEKQQSLTLRFLRSTGMLGRPTFVESASFVCGELCSRTWTNPRLAAVDMDGNGVADVVVLDGDGRFHWYAPASGGLSGGFTRVTSQHWLSHLHVDPRMRYVFADLTSDGKVDVVGLSLGVEPALVVYQDLGTDADPHMMLLLEVSLAALGVTGTNPTLYVLDVSGDGVLDVVLGNGEAAINTGSLDLPAFANPVPANAAPSGLVALLRQPAIAASQTAGVFVDYDGDSDLDFLFGGTAGTVGLWQNDGSWGFTAVGDGDNPFFNQSTVGGDRAAFAVRPMPGVTGYLELVQVNSAASVTAITFGNYSVATRVVTWDMSNQASVACPANPYVGVSLVDVHADRLADMLVTCSPTLESHGRPTVIHMERQATGAIVTRPDGEAVWASRIGINKRTAFAAADLDADGDVDLLLGDEFGAFWVENTAVHDDSSATARQFKVHHLASMFDVDMAYSAFGIADLDGDGLLDVVRGSTLGDSQTWAFFRNMGNGTHPTWRKQWHVVDSSQSTVSPTPFVFDMDGDGRIDVGVTTKSGSVVAWMLHTAALSPEFTVSTRLTSAFNDVPALTQASYAPMDLDGDGDTDIIAGGETSIMLLANTAVECLPQCNGHGVCVNSPQLEVLAPMFACSCQARFTGAQCDKCAPGYYGVDCVNACPSATSAPCSGKGVCDYGVYGSGLCTCDEGYSGDGCESGGCVPGKGFDEATGTCATCGAGKYKSLSLNMPCLDCPPGRFTNETAQHQCTRCEPGRFQGIGGQTQCELCPAGSATNSSGQVVCALCRPGQYSPSKGGKACIDCDPGKFTSCAASQRCEVCPQGHFSNATGMPLCDVCPVGRYANATGQTDCPMCDPGTFNNAKGQPRCFLCKIGTYSALPGASVCTRCKEGSAGPEDGLRECPPCERGQFASQSGQADCSRCGEGEFANTTGSTACFKCPAGTRSNPGAPECLPCLRGEVQPPGTRRCEKCRRGSYSLIAGEPINEECHPCPAGAYCEGGDSIIALEGYWRSSRDSFLFHECTRKASCLGFPAGLEFGATLGTARRLTDHMIIEGCQEGYVGPLCFECAPGYGRSGTSACGKCQSGTLFVLGGAVAVGALLVAFLVWKQIRAGDKLEALLLDAQAKQEQARRNAAHDSKASAPHPTSLGSDLAVRSAERIKALNARDLRRAVQDPEQNIEAAIVKVLMNNLQVLALAASFELSWPEWLLTIFSVQDSGSSVSGRVFSLDCVLKAQPGLPSIGQEVFLFTMLPLVLFAGAAVFWFCVHPRIYRKHVRRHKLAHSARLGELSESPSHVVEMDPKLRQLKRHWAMDPAGHRAERYVVTIIVMFFLLQSSVLKKGFALFACVELDPGQFVLSNAMDYKCYTTEHWIYMWTLGLFNLGFYAFGVPLFVLRLLYKRRHRLNDVDMLAKFGFLTMGYEPQYWYYEIIVMARKVAMLGAVSFMAKIDTQVQTLVGILIVVTALVLQAQLKPYDAKTLDHLETAGLGVSAFTLYGGLFLFHAGIPTAAKIVITITIAVANVGFLLYGVILIFKQIKQRAAVLCGKLGRSRACGCCARRCCPRITRGSPGDSNVHLFTRHSSSQVVPDAVLAPNGAVIVDPVTGPESSSGRGAGAKPVPVRGNESPTSPWRTAVIGRSKDMLGSADDLAMQPVEVEDNRSQDGCAGSGKQRRHDTATASALRLAGFGNSDDIVAVSSTNGSDDMSDSDSSSVDERLRVDVLGMFGSQTSMAHSRSAASLVHIKPPPAPYNA